MIPNFAPYCSKYYYLDGIEHWVFYFKNNYGASVVHGDFINGYELAVLKNDGNDSWEICYTTEITNDVIFNLDENDIIRILENIERI